MNISVKAHRSVITSPTTIDDIEICISDFVRRDDDHRPALAAMNAEIQQALDAAETDLRDRNEPELRSVADLLKSPAGKQVIRQALDAAGQGSR